MFQLNLLTRVVLDPFSRTATANCSPCSLEIVPLGTSGGNNLEGVDDQTLLYTGLRLKTNIRFRMSFSHSPQSVSRDFGGKTLEGVDASLYKGPWLERMVRFLAFLYNPNLLPTRLVPWMVDRQNGECRSRFVCGLSLC